MKEKANRLPMHEAAPTLPPLLGKETSVNEIDSFPTHRHSHTSPSVFDKHVLLLAWPRAHTQRHTLRREEQTEMKGINRLEADI